MAHAEVDEGEDKLKNNDTASFERTRANSSRLEILTLGVIPEYTVVALRN